MADLRTKRACVTGLAVFVLLASVLTGTYRAVPAGAETTGGAGSSTPSAVSVNAINRSSRASVRASYRNVMEPTLSVPINWNGSTATCNRGEPSAAARNATLTAVNWFREMAGLSPVYFDAGLNNVAQAAALMMDANTSVSHSPPPSWRCYTAEGAAAAGKSNLFLRTGPGDSKTGARAVVGYMADSEPYNQAVGHRRWLLYPPQQVMGSGSTYNANALYVNAPFGPTPGSPQFVPWPSAGYFPAPMEPNGRWSFSLNSLDLTTSALSNATVTVTRNGVNVPVTVYPREPSPPYWLANPTIVWDMNVPAVIGAPDQTYHVKIWNISGPGLPSTYEYDVTLFDPNIGTAPDAPAKPTVVAGDGFVTVSWSAPYDGDSPITGYTVTSNPGNHTCTTMGALTCTITGLTNATPYTFTVRATNAAGTSPASPVSNQAVPGLVPSAPGTPTVSVSDTDVQVDWTPPAEQGSTPVVGYQVVSMPDGRTCTTSGALSCTVTGLTSGTSYTFKVAAINATGAGELSDASEAVVPMAPATWFHPMSPTRLIDPRPAWKVGPFSTPWGHGATRDVQVAGELGIPADAKAVVLNVTATDVLSPIGTFISVYPKGSNRPNVSSLNASYGQTIANSVTTKIGFDGKITIYNDQKTANVIVDVAGYYTEGPGDGYVALAPVRVVDPRPTWRVGPFSTPWGAGTTRNINIGADAGVPADAEAVVLNVTVTDVTKPSFFSVYPKGSAVPNSSNLNFTPGDTVANQVVVKMSSNAVTIRNEAGKVNVIVDVVGYFSSTSGDRFFPLAPQRLIDPRAAWRIGPFSTPWGGGVTRPVQTTGNVGVSEDATAVIMNVTATDVTSVIGTFVTVFPGGTVPNASNLNAGPGWTIANAVTAKLSPDGKISVFNEKPTANVIIDVGGYYA